MKTIATENNFYRTADLALAAVISLYYPLESVDGQNPRRVFLCFKRNEQLDNLIDAYWRKELKIEPQTYYGALRTLKARLVNDGY